jgi:molybdopterin-guanine dinucleotide biosynthesis protein A
MTLLRNPRRCRESRRCQHQYKTRSHRIVPKIRLSRKHQCYHPGELTNLGAMNRAGWVLAGGRSRRMGTDKALIEMDGQPPFRRVAGDGASNPTNVEWNLPVACDMPSLDASVLEELFVASEGADGAVPSYGDGRIEQLSAVLHARCHAAVPAALEVGVLKVGDVLARLKLRYVPVSTPDSFANLNTPEDLERYEDKRDG